jgi:glycosyltransferase involved in cell wall biosynthesis
MKFLIVSHAEHYKNEEKLLAYAPYVREMNLWLKHVESIEILAPLAQDFDKNINLAYQHQKIKFNEVPAFSLLSLKQIFSTILKLPSILKALHAAMKRADHIHLRCPGNLGLLGCLVQMCFPNTQKTAKYAGNWDPKAKQPWSYNLQKWILKNTFLTKNMQVLVYGEWPYQSKNIKPFFTASFNTSETEKLYIRNYSKALHFCFVGTLSPGKNPDKALDVVYRLRQKGIDAVLHIYGDGEMKSELQKQIENLNAEQWAFMYGNQPQSQIKKALKYSHFLILQSQSEGWPKAVAEAMFFGCIPITSQVSCLPWMLENGKRGILVDIDHPKNQTKLLKEILIDSKKLEQISLEAYTWSTQYTLDKFEEELISVLNSSLRGKN